MNSAASRAAALAKILQKDADTLHAADRAVAGTLSEVAAEVSTTSVVDQDSPYNAPPTAFVSWAHAGEAWTDERAAEWLATVVAFVGRLRRNGIDADLDVFHTSNSSVDWTRFGPQGVARADFVLVVLSEAWAQRWSGTNSPSVGAGAVAEADTLRGLFSEDQAAWQRKVVLVVLPGQEKVKIPADLARINRFTVDPDLPDSLDSLLRTLTAQPLYEAPELGAVPVLPPAVSDALKVRARIGETADHADYRTLLKRVQGERNKVAQGKSGDDQLALFGALLDSLLE